MIAVTLKEHLKMLEAAEAGKPPQQRRNVPSLPDLAEAVGVSRATLYNMSGGYVDSVNLKTLSRVLNELRRLGFGTELTDLLTAYPMELTEGAA